MPNNNNNQRKIKRIFNNLRKIFTLNIGTVLFGALLIYMIFSMIIYITSTHFTTYQVNSGPLSSNETFTGLAVHSEKVVSADVGGYINYYAREGSKVNSSGIVYGISSTSLESSSMDFSAEDLSRVRTQMSNFSYGFKSSNFNSTYSFKSELEGNLLQYAGVSETTTKETDSSWDSSSDSSQEEITQTEVVDTTLGNQTLSRTEEDGIILYSKDGYESLNTDNISKENFDQNAYHKEDLKTREPINAGDDVYTIITDERWSLYVPLTDKQATTLADWTSIRVKFLKDGISQTGSFSVIEIEDGKYGKIDFNNGLIRYASDRFLDVELVTNTQSGLKVPLSAVTSKEFYLIPTDYQTKGGNDQEAGFLVERGSGNSATTEFVNASIYAENDDKYYVEKSSFEEGTVLVKPDSSDRYVLQETGNLEGVYCVNEGYARFRVISIIDQNEEYCIVEKNTSYGLSQYDRIVFNCNDVNEEDILY